MRCKKLISNILKILAFILYTSVLISYIYVNFIAINTIKLLIENESFINKAWTICLYIAINAQIICYFSKFNLNDYYLTSIY